MVQRGLDYVNRSKKFLLTAEDKKDAFERQYCHIYVTRLDAMKMRILEAAKKELGDVQYKQLEELEMFEKAFVIGTIEKRISMRPGVLKEIAEDEMAMPEDYEPDEMMSIVSNKDFLEFEDEKQIVKLEGNIQMDIVATGCTVGLYGSQVKSDVFNVEKLVWPAPCPQRSWPSKKTGAVVAFLSGLDLTGDAVSDASVITSLESVSRLLSGEDSKDLVRGSLFSRVERLVVLGESISIGQAHEFASAVHYLNLDYKEASSNVETIAVLDTILSKLSECSSLPSESDTTTSFWHHGTVTSDHTLLLRMDHKSLHLRTEDGRYGSVNPRDDALRFEVISRPPGSVPGNPSNCLLTTEECKVLFARTRDRDRSRVMSVKKVKLDLMPGVGDPCSQQIPQQPIHPACLPKSTGSDASLTLPTNPYEFTLGDLDFLATSGRSVSDLRRLSGVHSSCDLMELILRWQHLAPTCPDTVDGYPFEKRDPLVMDGVFPHVMVAGNQPATESRWFEGSNGERCLMISVARFSRTQTLVLLDLDTMEVLDERFA